MAGKVQDVSTDFTLSWKEGPKAPERSSRGSFTKIGNTLYFNGDLSEYIFTIDTNATNWGKVPEKCPRINSTLVNINQELSTVGGDNPDSFETTDNVFTYRDQKWVEVYPPMPTKRKWAIIFTTGTHVVVLGGSPGSPGIHSVVEILDTQTKQWSTASPLPYGIYVASTTLNGDSLFLVGGVTDTGRNNGSVITCNVQELLESAKKPTPDTHSDLWRSLSDLPVYFSTCVTVRGQLVVIGGIEPSMKKMSTVVYRYNQNTNEWIKTEMMSMNIARYYCQATLLSDDKLLVVGGWTEGRNPTDETEIATIA